MTETNSTDETLARITELARQALQSQSTLAKQSLELGRAALSGDVDRSTTSKAYLDAVSREGARYWREAGALGLDYASELMALGTPQCRPHHQRRLGGRCGTRARRGDAPRPATAPRGPPRPEPDDGLRRSRVLLRAGRGTDRAGHGHGRQPAPAGPPGRARAERPARLHGHGGRADRWPSTPTT